jgi:hypothetical protein
MSINKLRASVAALAVAPIASFAAVPAEVTTALADIGTDGATVAGVILLAVVTVFAVKFLRRGL